MTTPRTSIIPLTHLSCLITALALLAMAPATVRGDEPYWVELPDAERSKPISGTVEAETFALLAQKLTPAVVLIRVSLPQHPLLTPAPESGEFQDAGTGFIIRSDGYILTNNHVVENVRGIRVRLEDERELEATLVGAFALADLALLKVTSDKPLVAAPLGDSDQLRIAEWVLAIGSPFGLNNTVTAGIISAKGRKEITPEDRPIYADFIQTDASINPGNSGGPLINMRGEVIGINSAIYRSAQGIGFAIPVNMAKKLLPQLARGKVERAYLGIVPQDLTAQNAQALGLEKAEGALVAQVIAKSPAAEAGLQVGDIIVRFNDQPVKDSADLRWLASIAGVGTNAAIEVQRKRDQKVFSVAMAPHPDDGTQVQEATGPVEGLDIPGLGLQVRALTPKERAAGGLPGKRGILITGTTRGGSGAMAGLRPGDIILRFGYASVQSPSAFARMVDNAATGAPIVLHIQREGYELWVNLRKR